MHPPSERPKMVGVNAVAAPHVDLSGPVERPSTASPGWLLGAAGLIAGLGVAAGLAISFSRHGVRDSPAWRRDGYSDVLELLVTAGAATLAGVGIVWWRRRPGNRIGGLLVCLGADVAAVQSFFWLDTRWMLVAWTLATLALRPLISWLVLAWPAGRLRPSDRRVVAGFAAVEFAIGLAALLSFAPADSRNPIGLLDWPDASAVFFDLNQLVVMPVGAAIVLGIVVRRRRSLPVGARRLALPVVIAASIALAADAIPNPARGFVGDLLDGTAGTTPLGFVVGLFDAGRFVAIAVTLAWAGRLQLRSTPAGTAIRYAEIGELAGQSSVRDLLSAATGDPTARIAYRRASGWLGAGGAPVELGGAGRTVTLLERDREPVAAVELDCTFDDRPSALETAAATVAAALDNERYQALALARLADVQQARLRILDAEDAARRRLERDLHDGAQQHLVGLALEARLAALGRDPVEIDALRAGIAAGATPAHWVGRWCPTSDAR